MSLTHSRSLDRASSEFDLSSAVFTLIVPFQVESLCAQTNICQGFPGMLPISSQCSVHITPSQPTVRETRLPQTARDERTAFHQSPQQSAAMVFDHQDDRPLVESEMPR